MLFSQNLRGEVKKFQKLCAHPTRSLQNSLVYERSLKGSSTYENHIGDHADTSAGDAK